MIDIHAHILPGVDDGPTTLDDSLAMLRMAEADGIKGVMCTSHFMNHADEALIRLFQSQFKRVRDAAKKEGLSLDLWLAAEIHINARVHPLHEKLTFNGNKKYALVELPMNDVPGHTDDIFFKLELDGVIPILAHPERNMVLLNRPGKIEKWVHRGILMQVNAGSLMGVWGRKVQRLAERMIDHQLAHFVASDCHNITGRPPRLSDAYARVLKMKDAATARTLFEDHPRAVIKGETFSRPEPLPLENASRGLLSHWLKRGR